MCVAISSEKYLAELNKFLKELKSRPRETKEVKKQAVEKLQDLIFKKQQDVIVTLITNLYGFEYNAIKADVAKIILMNAQRDATPEERLKLLSALFGSVGRFVHDDYSFLVNECERVINFHVSCGEGGEDVEKLPFV